MIDIFKTTSLNVFSIALSLIFFSVYMFGSSVFALTEADYNAIHGNYVWYDPDASTCGEAAGSGGSNIFVIGDSLTVGMRDAGELSQKLEGVGWKVLGIEATGGITTSQSVEKIAENASKVSDADTVVVALGTNKENNQLEKISQMVGEIRERSTDATIYWVNAYTGDANYDDINKAIEDGAKEFSYNVIDWKSEYLANPGKYPWGGSDQIHHSPEGYKAKADFLVNELGQPTLNGSNFNGDNNQEIAFNFFRSKGLTPEQSAGIVGNLIAESGVDPEKKQYGGGPGRGLAQWEVGGRWDNLILFADGNGKDPLLIETQLDYLWYEFTGEPETPGARGGAESAAFEHLKGTTTVAEAAASFMIKFERPADQSPAKQAFRAELAQPVFDAYAGNAIVSSNGSCSNSGSVSIDGFWFPVETTKSEIREGVEGGIWCYEDTTNCHHDYNAADIHVPVGTNVIAATSGEIQMKRERLGGGGSSVVILGDDGNTYYYTHMKHNSLVSPEVGERIEAGANVGQVGERSQAQGTAPHLHFDALPSDKHKNRPGCSDSACQAFPFLDVQTRLAELYGQLPE